MEYDLNYCMKNIFKDSFKDIKTKNMYTRQIKRLFQNKLGSFSENEARFIISYFVKIANITIEIDKHMQMRILSKNETDEELKEANGLCMYNSGLFRNSHQLVFSHKIVEKIQSNDYMTVMSGLSTVFHEITHSIQNESMLENTVYPKIYIMCMETLTRRVDKQFYSNNYNHLLKETHAEIMGLRWALEVFKHFRFDLYSKIPSDLIQKEYKEYNDKFFKSNFLVCEEIDSPIKQIDKYASQYIEQNPKVCRQFPILQYSFNQDGSRKSLKQLLFERQFNLSNSKSKDEIKELNELYRIIINERQIDIDKEIDLITDYIYESKYYDKFIDYILKYRVNRSNMGIEDKDIFFQNISNYIEECKGNVK